MREKVLGVNVDVLGKEEVLNIILSWVNDRSSGLKHVVTAYSEFFVKAKTDVEFKQVLNSSDLVTPDGVSVLAAVNYGGRVKGAKTLPGKILAGLKTGMEVIGGRVGETVTGVWLFEALCEAAGKKGLKIFLLGGWDGVAGRAARLAQKRYPGIKIEFDEGEKRVGTDPERNREVVERINKFRPDVLFVSYNPVKQEKWIAKHRKSLKVVVAIGVGGTYNEFVGDLLGAPKWMAKSGLKWLWRLWLEPKRLGRILSAVIVFPWLVFRESLG